MLFILVQIQAGPPAFALRSYGWAATLAVGEALSAVARRAKADGLGRHSSASLNPKIPVDGPFLGVSRVRNLV